MGVLLKLVQAIGKYGKKAVDWVWKNKKKILKWIDAGLTFTTILELIKAALRALGII